MRVCPRIVVLCLLLSAGLAVPVHAAASANPGLSLYPPASVFLLPARIVGGTVTVNPEGSCCRQDRHAEFEYIVSGYRIAYDVDEGTTDAFPHTRQQEDIANREHDQWTIEHLSPDDVFGQDEWAAIKHGAANAHGVFNSKTVVAVAGVGFHNIYLNVNVALDAPGEADFVSTDAKAVAKAIWLLRILKQRAQGFAAQEPNSSAQPSAPVHTLPTSPGSLLYPPYTLFSHNGFSLDPQSLDQGLASLASWNARSDYEYSDGGSPGQAHSYEVITFDSDADARVFNAADTVPNYFKSTQVPSRITREERAWLRWSGSAGDTCTLLLTLVTHNLVLQTSADSTCSDDGSGHISLARSDAQQETVLLAWMLARVRSYALTAPASPVAQRNHAFVLLYKDIQTRLERCRRAIAPAYQALQSLIAGEVIGRGDPQHVLALAQAASGPCNSYPFLYVPGTTPPGYILDPSLVHEQRVWHLVYTDVYKALAARGDAALAISQYATGIERKASADTLLTNLQQINAYMTSAPRYDQSVERDSATIARNWGIQLP